MDDFQRRMRREGLGGMIKSSGAGNAGNAAGRAVMPVLLGLGGLLALTKSLFNVEGGHRAVVFNKITGLKERVYDEGTHILIPFVEHPIVYETRTKPRTLNSLTGSKDLQMVTITLRILFKPRAEELTTIYRTLGHDYDERVLPSIANEVLKSVVAQFNASQLITQRARVSSLILKGLTERAADFNIELDDVSITHLAFGKEYTAAIEAKQVAQQEAERARFVVEKAQQDKKATIIRAQGEARSAKMVSDAIQRNPTFLQLRRLEAAREIAQLVAQSNNRVFLNADSLLLNLLDDREDMLDAHKRR